MSESPRPHRIRFLLLAALIVLGGLLLHLPVLDEPLLEGAAGKQTHTAMIARNFERGRGTFFRPTVDDVGPPGYFVKEVPLLPGAAAVLYRLTGAVDESLGRIASLAAWLAGIPLVAALVRRAGGDTAGLAAAAWWVGSPLALVYASAFMSDAALVTASVAALLALVRWREAPAAGRAVSFSSLLCLALLLKPHAVFWLGPAGLVVASRDRRWARRPRRRDVLLLLVGSAAAAGIAALWYLHAARVHALFPVAGTTGLTGWFDAPSLLTIDLYAEIFRQTVGMAFSPVGALIAVAGVILAPRGWHPVERALLAWGAGVLLQCLVFDTRMFDHLARGTEYYQLPMVPVAGALIARGLVALARLAARRGPALAGAVVALAVALLTASVAREARAAREVPDRYRRILDDCAVVRSLTRPHEEVFVFADRGGTILYYCDRRGSTFVPARAVRQVFAHADNVAGAKRLADALDRASYVYVPFPELFSEGSRWLAFIEENWERVDLPGQEMRLYRKPRPGARRR